jgi:hypothetical protein
MLGTGYRAELARVAAVLLTLVLAAACGALPEAATPARPFAGPRPAPLVGVDMIYQDAPHVLLRAFADPERGAALAATLENGVGVTVIRLNSFGFYSFLGPERSVELRRLTEQRNVFPWFPIDDVVDFVVRYDLKIVAGLNPEDGPEAAVAYVERFRARGALDRIVAIELGNEPHLSHRPWQPEEYAAASAAIIRALEPFGVKFAVSLTVGSEAKTPTGISDDDYTRRELAALDAELRLAERDDIYGVVHLYARGVDPATVDRLSAIVHPVAPRMRYLITEYNIRSTLKDNAHLTDDYAIEFIEKTGRLVAHPDVAGLFVHGVPYHSVVYWVGDARITTVSGYGDARLTGDAATPGWHLTPAGRMYGLFARELWRGELLDHTEAAGVQTWTARWPDGSLRLGVLNATDAPLARAFTLDGAEIAVTLGPRSGVVYTTAGEVGRVELREP